MSDVPPTEPTGPQIGADEWVARSGERDESTGGFRGRVVEAFDRIPKPAVFAIVVALAAVIPLLTSHTDNDIYYLRVGTVALVFALLALGLNVAVGFAGLLDLGYIAYYGVGAYGYAMLSSDKFGLHWQAWQSIIVVVGVSALVGFLLALPSRRLVGDYLAIVTLFFGQIFYVIVTQGYRVSLLGLNKDLGLDRANWDLTGGPNGIANVDRFRAFGFTASSERAYFYVTLTAVVVVFAALSLVNRSRTGRAWRALHDERTDNGPDKTPGAPEDHHGVDDDQDLGVVVVGEGTLEQGRVDRSGQCSDGGTKADRHDLELVDRDAHRLRGKRVVV